MCVIIDTNTLSPVFDKENKEHKQFKPVFDWIYNRKVKIVYGGTDYKRELQKATKFLKLFIEFDKTRKMIVKLSDKKVDEEQKKVQDKIKKLPDNTQDFNDSHLIAIVIVSGCRIICSHNKRHFKLIKNKKLYPSHIKIPKIYSGHNTHKKLLCDKNIIDI